MKLLIALAVLVAAASAMRMTDEEVKPHFEAFKAQHGKTYADATEEAFRMKIFKDNLIKINQHNERHARGEVTFTVGINQFADLHSHEVVERMNGLKPKTTKSLNVHYAPRLGWPQSKSVDWRTKGYVTPVKDQGQCGDCFAFSTTGSLEGQLFKKTGKLVSLSEQQITDCSTSRKYGNAGCDGGNMDSSFQYIKDAGGIDTEESYPFIGRAGRCRYNKAHSAGVTTGYVDVNPTEQDLEHAVATVGPVSVGIDASNWSFQYYSGGVYNEPWCSSTSLDHAVLVVGYGSTSNSDYWIVKNSWGTSWGEEGYIKMARNKNNKCGIASMASYPTV